MPSGRRGSTAATRFRATESLALVQAAYDENQPRQQILLGARSFGLAGSGLQTALPARGTPASTDC
jgi:hypothetical protein